MDDTIQDQLRRAGVLADTNRPEQALILLASVRAADPGSVRGHLLAARCLLALDRAGESLNAANQAASTAPDSPNAHIMRSRAYLRLGENDDAFAAAMTAIGLAPNAPDAHICAAYALASSGRTKQAFDHAHEAVRLAPNAAAPHVAHSYVAIAARKWREGETAARLALSLDPDSSAAMNNLGIALRHRRRPFAAVQSFARASRSDPKGRVSQGNSNAAILNVTGWVLSLLTVTVVLVIWLTGSHPQLSRQALVVTVAVSATLTGSVLAVVTTWFVRLPRAARHSLLDSSAWIGLFNGKVDRGSLLVGRGAWYLCVFFGVPVLFSLDVIWNSLEVIQGSKPAGSALGIPIALLVISLVFRSGLVRAARRQASAPSRQGRSPS
jgi:tetratricopeptide (TPR) repeat protein